MKPRLFDWWVAIMFLMVTVYVTTDAIKDGHDHRAIQRLQQRMDKACLWGTSSTIAIITKDGSVQVAAPSTDGCQP